jgi:protein TonB
MKKITLLSFLSLVFLNFSFCQTLPEETLLTVCSCDSVDHKPEFPGGFEELKKFITNNVVYPDSAKHHLIEGFVLVQVIVDENGKTESATVLKPVNEYLDKEAIRVVKSMPDWVPGLKNGENVKCSLKIPFNFKLYY